MIVNVITRGNTVSFSATFYDADGEVTVPASASVSVNYLNTSSVRETTDPIAMSEQTDGSWHGEWSTAGALPARIYWSVKSTGPLAAGDGVFDLSANLANLAT